eukprot:TRINITY_DN1622_c1_g1_i12.p1 TRINITY_DN1622_c1_g1~~TRINITY_DN1622_c1_g1_i12.p1  ORF type:complete len:328 (+),score=41.20 TRINITY_DN1622_c1_g1_i12:145-1128(+)
MLLRLLLISLACWCFFCHHVSSYHVNGEYVDSLSGACPSAPDFPRLKTYIESAVHAAGYCQWLQWGVTDFHNNTILSSNADVPFESASSIKLWVMISVLQDVEAGKYKLTDTLLCSGETRTVDACLSLMISISDNCATYDNVLQTSITSVNRVMKALGMKNSALHHWCFTDCPGYVTPCKTTDGSSADNALTARDVITGLTALYQNEALSPAMTKQAYAYLVTAHGWTPMLARFPPVQVAHKQGWLPASMGFQPLTENDEAIIFACAPVGVVVLIQQRWTNSGADTPALNVGAQIGRLSYCTMDTNGTSTDGQKCSATWATKPGQGC